MCWELVTSDLPVFDPIDKKFLLQNVIKTRTKTINVTEYENDASVLWFPNHVAGIHQVVSRNTSTTTKTTGRACFEIKKTPDFNNHLECGLCLSIVALTATMCLPYNKYLFIFIYIKSFTLLQIKIVLYKKGSKYFQLYVHHLVLHCFIVFVYYVSPFENRMKVHV